MKILAVIPARAGSKGVPNKNIRIINGKPLISYAIENALASEMITDVVVSSDSPEIELISRKYNIAYRKRDPKLCADAVTLDAVIYDAAKDYKVDYIVTMQPTSPTLKVATLDKAIKYAISEDYDTVISAVNRPHLAWVEKNNKVIPDYKERLNRQYMPKRFLETGAFVISKASVVTEKTRIGDKVNIFEIDDDESIDIDNFQDLLCVEQILTQKKMAFVVNGNNQIGLGHIYRTLELADLFYSKPDFYYNATETEASVFGKTTYHLIPFASQKDLISLLEKGKYNVIINDILDTSAEYIGELKKLSAKPAVINFEDLGKGATIADLVINALYDDSKPKKNVRCGEKYYIVPKLFMLYEPIKINAKIKNVLICFGGADPRCYTEKILKLISSATYSKINFTIILGKMKKNASELIESVKNNNIVVLRDTKNMPELMSQADVAITSRGRTCYELASLGVPTLAIAQNNREEKHTFACEDNGFIYIGQNPKEDIIADAVDILFNLSKSERKIMQEKMLKHNLRDGRRRVKNLIESI